MIIGHRIQERLDACGMSQASLARAVKLQQSTINGLVRGEQRSSTKLHQIARELRTTPAYLTGETDDPKADIPDSDLSGEEREWVDMLRVVPPKDKAAILQLTKSIASSAPSPTLHEPHREFKRAANG